MGSPRVSSRGIRSPRGWLGLAFIGVWLYFVSQLLRLFPERAAEWLALSVSEAKEVLAISSGLGQILFFAGLVAALWRANRVVGLSRTGIRGLVLGVAGVGILVLFEVAMLMDWMGVGLYPVAVMVRSPTMDAGIIAGTAVAFTALASLGVGLAQATNLFGRGRPEAVASAAHPEETS